MGGVRRDRASWNFAPQLETQDPPQSAGGKANHRRKEYAMESGPEKGEAGGRIGGVFWSSNSLPHLIVTTKRVEINFWMIKKWTLCEILISNGQAVFTF
jgi:hypothetical protein